MGSLSLLQWVFPTQKLNWGLLHCRRIPYQLRYEATCLLLTGDILKRNSDRYCREKLEFLTEFGNDETIVIDGKTIRIIHGHQEIICGLKGAHVYVKVVVSMCP